MTRLLILMTLAAGCHASNARNGIPLYPNATPRPPRDQIAEVMGPIALVDGQNVADQGGWFELLPGCHIVELDRRVTTDPVGLTNAMQWSGTFPAAVYALPMKPGGRYAIRRQILDDGMPRVLLSAREELPGGQARDLNPATSDADIKACKEWKP